MDVGVVRARKNEVGRAIGANVTSFELVSPGPYAEAMRAHEIVIAPEGLHKVSQSGFDTYIYVLSGSGEILLATEKQQISEGSAALVLDGESVQISHDQKSIGSLCLLLIDVPAPITPWSHSLAKAIEIKKRIVLTRLGQSDAKAASSNRQFEVLFDASNGSRSATMFVGFIPSSGAPEHYHLYDEICVIVRGRGALQVQDRQVQPLEKGSAFHVAPRFLHAIHNPNPEDLWILGVFRPEGSAADAFYPDGRPAPVSPER